MFLEAYSWIEANPGAVAEEEVLTEALVDMSQRQVRNEAVGGVQVEAKLV